MKQQKTKTVKINNNKKNKFKKFQISCLKENPEKEAQMTIQFIINLETIFKTTKILITN